MHVVRHGFVSWVAAGRGRLTALVAWRAIRMPSCPRFSRAVGRTRRGMWLSSWSAWAMGVTAGLVWHAPSHRSSDNWVA